VPRLFLRGLLVSAQSAVRPNASDSETLEEASLRQVRDNCARVFDNPQRVQARRPDDYEDPYDDSRGWPSLRRQAHLSANHLLVVGRSADLLAAAHQLANFACAGEGLACTRRRLSQ
jgi:hypothetical protein